jgi:uncharacterized protein YrrD
MAWGKEQKMPRAHIRLGAPVYSRDGQKLGKVDRLILNDTRRRVKALVVHKLILGGDKIIEMPLVERVGEKGIVLRIDADEAERLPAFLREEFVEVTPEAALDALYASLAPGVGTFLASPVAGRHTIEDVIDDGRLTPIPADARVTVESNVPDFYDVISPGTDVFAIDGQKIGTVDEVIIDGDGDILGFVVKEGFLLTRDMFIPVDWIYDIGHEHIHLKLTAQEVEEQSQQPPDRRFIPAPALGA